MSRHKTTNTRPWAPLAIIAGVLVAGGIAVGAGALVSADRPGPTAAASASSGCATTPVTLRVAVASGYRPVLQQLADDPCVQLELSSGDGFDGAVALKNGAADVWIADSRQRAYVVDPELAAAAPSLASSPVVMSVSPATSASLGKAVPAPDWSLLVPSDATSGLSFQIQDSSGSSAVLAVADAVATSSEAASGDEYLAYAATAKAITRLEANPADVTQPVPADTVRVGELRLVGSDTVVPVATGLPSLSYPWIEPTVPSDGAVAAAASELLARLQSADGLEAAADAGFLPPDANAASIAGDDVALSSPPAIDETPLLFTLADASVFSARVLALLDVSGSMADVPPGGTVSGMDALKQSMTLFATTMPDNVEVGGWAFGYQLAPPNDYVPLVTPAPLSQTRSTILGLAQSMQPQDTGTALYSTFLAAYRNAQENYDPSNLNVVAVFTDGKNEDAPGALDLQATLAQLGAVADPNKPIIPLFFGFGNSDVPAMQQITSVVGGDVWRISQPEQIVGAMIEAISQYARIGIPAELSTTTG
ncbi:VWA domain-containing protein [Microbacteriaceae bacterium VKM Ac-2854]|nr:VWA domain-containing protein [Microbacteriaceae bacterium VKM Ac-2854]